MFQAIILPIFRNTRLCVTACGITHPQCCRQHRGCIIPQAVKHSFALLRMGKKLPETCWADWNINKLLLSHLVGLLHYLSHVISSHCSRRTVFWQTVNVMTMLLIIFQKILHKTKEKRISNNRYNNGCVSLYVIYIYTSDDKQLGSNGYRLGARGGAVGWGTALQAGRSRVRFPMVPLEFFSDLILPAAPFSSNRNKYLE